MRTVAGVQPSTTRLALRGFVATVVAVVVGAVLIARGAGALDPGVTVSSTLPSEAGPVPENAPTYYLGVRVGEVRQVAGGDPRRGPATVEGAATDGATGAVPGSELEILLEPGHADRVPRDATVRAVPRTLFGDVRLELVPPDRPGVLADRPVADGAVLAADTSDEAVELYDVFTRTHDLIAATEPQHIQVILTELARALDGRGATLGRTLDRVDEAGAHLMPALEDVGVAAGDVARVAEDVDRATPDVLATLEHATELSRVILDRPGAVGALLDAGLDASTSAVHTWDTSGEDATRVVHDGARIVGDIATDPHGVVRTLEGLEPMGSAGSVVFSTGRFNITAVPSFQDPMPYGPEDCPDYQGVPGSTCTAPGGGAWTLMAPLATDVGGGRP